MLASTGIEPVNTKHTNANLGLEPSVHYRTPPRSRTEHWSLEDSEVNPSRRVYQMTNNSIGHLSCQA